MHLIACLNVIKSFKLKDLKHRLETKYDYLLNELKEKEAEYNERETFCKAIKIYFKVVFFFNLLL